jgi:hypothetical protein
MKIQILAIGILIGFLGFNSSSHAESPQMKRLFQCNEWDKSDTNVITMYSITGKGYLLLRKEVISGKLLGQVKFGINELSVQKVPPYTTKFDSIDPKSERQLHIFVNGHESSVLIKAPRTESTPEIDLDLIPGQGSNCVY